MKEVAFKVIAVSCKKKYRKKVYFIKQEIAQTFY